MSTLEAVERDEHPVAVETASYWWAYPLLSYALLVDVMYRSLVRHEAAWDLLILVIVCGSVCTAHQASQKALGHGWVPKALLAVAIAAAIAAVLTMSW
jgi:hypothetical protein